MNNDIKENIEYFDNLNMGKEPLSKYNEINNKMNLSNKTIYKEIDTMNLSKRNGDKELFSGERSFKENISDLTAEHIFILFENMSKDDMYDITIINEYLEKLENIYNNIEKKNKLKELLKWKEIFLMIGYTKNCYIIEWLDNLYK
jgi:hypothetical protein